MSVKPLAVALLACSRLLAADLDDIFPYDLRFQAGLPPSSAQVDSTGSMPGSSRTDDMTWQERGRWSLQWSPCVRRITPGGDGFCLLEVTSMRLVSSSASDGTQLKERSLLGAVHIGVAHVIAPRTMLEITAFGGAGTSWQESAPWYGQAVEVGARLGITWAPWEGGGNGRPVIGAALLMSYAQMRNDADLGGTRYDLTITQHGLTPALTAGWRF